MICDLCLKKTDTSIMSKDQTTFSFKVVCSQVCYYRFFSDTVEGQMMQTDYYDRIRDSYTSYNSRFFFVVTKTLDIVIILSIILFIIIFSIDIFS